MPKEAKERPPRVYKNKKGDKKYYLKEGKQRIKAHDINLVINNILSRSKASRRPIGRQNAAKLAKEALAKEELKNKALLEEQKLKFQQQTDMLNLRIKQIKEQAQAKNEQETKALEIEHAREKKEAEALRQIENAQKILEIENIKNEALKKEIQIQQQHAELLRRAEEAERQNLDYQARFAEEKYGGQLAQAEQKQLEGQQQLNALQERELRNQERLLREVAQEQVKREQEIRGSMLNLQDVKNGVLLDKAQEERIKLLRIAQEAKTAPNIGKAREAIERGLPELALAQAIKPVEEKRAEPAVNFPRDVGAFLGGDLQYEDEPLPPERQLPNRDDKAGNGNKERVSSLQYGLTEQQINNLMDDEPRFLKTVAADEIHTLLHGAKLIDDDYDDFGFIINLDKRDEDKYQHWVACYIDSDHAKEMCYYDPFGDPPTETINNGLRKLIQSLKLPYYLEAKYNMNKNQNLNSNRCGMHCMLFLRKMFSGEEFEEANNHSERDVMKFQKGLIGHGEPDPIKYI